MKNRCKTRNEDFYKSNFPLSHSAPKAAEPSTPIVYIFREHHYKNKQFVGKHFTAK